jgi:hypothetical protein
MDTRLRPAPLAGETRTSMKTTQESISNMPTVRQTVSATVAVLSAVVISRYNPRRDGRPHYSSDEGGQNRTSQFLLGTRGLCDAHGKLSEALCMTVSPRPWAPDADFTANPHDENSSC